MPAMTKEGNEQFDKALSQASLWINSKLPKNKVNRELLLNSLGGAGIGAIGLGGAAYMREKDKDEDERTSVALPALAGALLGGGAGAGYAYAKNMPNTMPTGEVDTLRLSPELKRLKEEAEKLQSKQYDESLLGRLSNYGISGLLDDTGVGASVAGYGFGKVTKTKDFRAGAARPNVTLRKANSLRSTPLNFDFTKEIAQLEQPKDYLTGRDAKALRLAKNNLIGLSEASRGQPARDALTIAAKQAPLQGPVSEAIRKTREAYEAAEKARFNDLANVAKIKAPAYKRIWSGVKNSKGKTISSILAGVLSQYVADKAVDAWNGAPVDGPKIVD